MKRRAEQRQIAHRRFRVRSLMLVGMFALCALIVVGRSAHLQVIEREFLLSEADARHVKRRTIASHRGSITDRNGEPLAISSPVDSVWANPKQLLPETDAIPQLARIIGRDHSQLLKSLNRNIGKEFLWLHRHAMPGQVAAISDLALPGVNVRREYRRFFPAGEVTSHLVGLTDIDDTGQEGLELAHNHALAGEAGAKLVLQDRLGRAVDDVRSISPVRHGIDLVTSIDLRIQYFAYRELTRAMEIHDAQAGSVVVLDIQTGEVLAIVNRPGYNPNNRAQYSGERSRNRAITDIYDPGSSIKPITLAAALESGVIEANSIIDTGDGSIQVGIKEIKDHHALGAIDLETLLARSSNVATTMVGMRMESEQFWETLTRFGFGSLTASGFPGESQGLLPHYRDWQKISQATISYGYGLSVTPLQLARAYAAIGNGGLLMPVSLLRVDTPPPGTRAVSEDVANHVVSLMERVVQAGGTGTRAAIPGYRVAGKTGTAWKYSGNGDYNEEKYLSFFAGLVPASNPRLAAVVVIDEPSKKEFYGGDVAAPVFSAVMGEALRTLAVAPDAAPGLMAGLSDEVQP
ncbi:MAG: penicillin-binding transpeptidase domain-containing protein [Pseudomonadota bacterium]